MGGHSRSRKRDSLSGAAIVPLGRHHVVDSHSVSSPTSRNLQATGKVRLGIGPTRDLVLIEGTTRALAATEIPDEVGDAFAAKTGFDPRALTTSYIYFRIHPQRLQAWREDNELRDRDLMHGGVWVIPD